MVVGAEFWWWEEVSRIGVFGRHGLEGLGAEDWRVLLALRVGGIRNNTAWFCGV